VDVTRKNDFLVGFDRGKNHRDDAAARTINEEETLIRSARFRKELFCFENDAIRFSQVVQTDWSVHVATKDFVPK